MKWTHFYTFNGQRIAVRDGWNGPVSWLQGDHLGSASMTTDANGNKTSEYRYTPFGSVRVVWGNLPTNRKFTGYAREDAIGGIDFAQARFYDSVIGRFLSADTIVPGASNPQSLNRYSYVFNRPTVMIDPSGHDPRDDFGHTMNDQCNYAGGCTNQVNPVVAHYVLSGGSPVAWNDLPAGHQAVFTGLGCYQRCYEADAGIRGSAENHTDEFAFDVASVVSGFRVAKLLVKAGQMGVEWLGAKIVQLCASNPNCIALLIAAESGSTGGAATRTLYRAMSQEEYHDFMTTGQFAQGINSTAGKYFATSAADAMKWGEWFYGNKPFRILAVNIAEADVQTFHYWPKLDGIGPAYYATVDQLKSIAAKGGIHVP